MRSKFCVLCWRPVSDYPQQPLRVSFFCIAHKASGDTRTTHQKHKRRLIKALEKKDIYVGNDQNKKNYYSFLSSQVLKLKGVPDDEFIRKASSQKSFNTLVKIILNKSKYYTKTYRKISVLSDLKLSNKENFTKAVMMVLDKEFNHERLSDIPFEIDNDKAWLKGLFEMLARHEVYMTVNRERVKGEGENKELRDRLAERINEMKQEKIEHINKRLASEFNLSEARISILHQQLIKENRV